jgi:hypothetical protein
LNEESPLSRWRIFSASYSYTYAEARIIKGQSPMRARSCTVCGAATSRFLFNDKWLGIPLCSEKCENEYLNTLTPVRREQVDKLQHINRLMYATRRNEAICWAIAGSGLLIIAASFLLTDAVVFLIGVLPLTCGAFSISYFEKVLNRLASQKRQIVI